MVKAKCVGVSQLTNHFGLFANCAATNLYDFASKIAHRPIFLWPHQLRKENNYMLNGSKLFVRYDVKFYLTF